MHLTDEDVIRILKLVEESNFNSLQLEFGDLKLTVSKGGISSGSTELKIEADLINNSVPVNVPEAVPKQASPQADVNGSSDIKDEEGLLAIKAPMVGTFYAAPEPGAEPFIRIGSKVDIDTTVGLIEVMKVFTSVVAGVKGEIAKCLVEDSQFVEYGQTLFLVRPTDK